MTEKPKKKLKFYETWTFIIIVCVIFPICFRGFLFSPRHIPSSSMKPTLLIGDYVFISKFSYGFSRYSFPFGHSFNYFEGRLGGDRPKRGDIIVFRPPTDTSTDYIKRLVGLPGDKLQMKGGKLFINDVELATQRVEDFTDEKPDGNLAIIKRYKETMSNGVSYEVLDEVENSITDDTIEFVVPAKHYFFMGDNRDNSADSRYAIGMVPEENLVGRADLLFFSNRSEFIKIWDWVVSFRGDRFIKKLTND